MRVHRFLALLVSGLALTATGLVSAVSTAGAFFLVALLAYRARGTSSARVTAIAAACFAAAVVSWLVLVGPDPRFVWDRGPLVGLVLALAGFVALAISILIDVPVEPVHVEVTQIVHAPPERVAALYLDWSHWPELFPATVRGVRFVDYDGGATFLEVDHAAEGKVPNVIRELGHREVLLDERNPGYHAFFLNRFEAVPAGTRYTVVADVALHGPLRVLSFLAGPVVRQRLERYVLDPVRRAAEVRQRRGQPRPPHARTALSA